MRILSIVFAVALAAVAAAQVPTVQVLPARLAVDPQTNTAAAVLLIANPGTSPAELLLMADDFVAEGQEVGLGAKTLFGLNDEAPSKPELAVTVPANGNMRVRIEVSKLTHAGIARSRLLDRARPLAELVAVKAQVPFNVAPVDWKAGTPFALRFDSGTGPLLFLENKDPNDYLVNWALSTPGLPLKQSAKPIRVAAQSTQVVEIPADGWVPKRTDLGAILRSRESGGVLRLTATDAKAGQTWKTRDLPVTVQRSYFSPAQQSFRTFLLLALFVGAGGIASLIVTHWVPNRLRRIAVRELIEGITPKIRAISTAVESNLRTGVRVERTRLLQRLRSRSALSPDFAALAKDCQAAALRLDREIAILDRVDVQMRRIQTTWPTAGVHGPTLLVSASSLLGAAQTALDRPQVDDDLVSAAKTLVDKAEATIENAATLDELSKNSVVERLNALQSDPLMATSDATAIISSVPGLAAILAVKPPAVTTGNFADADTKSAKLEFIRRFVEIAQVVTGPEKQKSITDVAAALRRGGYADFRTAEAITTQLREGMFADAVKNAIKAGQYSITLEPQAPKVNQAVSFAIEFHDAALNTAAARDAIICEWEFHHEPAPEDGWRIARAARKAAQKKQPKGGWQTWTEKGLTVSHYFPTAGTFQVEALFKDLQGQSVANPNVKPEEVIVTGEKQGWFGERTKIEFLRLAIVLAITVAGLLVGARDELAKLDIVPGLIAVFMLGFTADQIKNILAPPANS